MRSATTSIMPQDSKSSAPPISCGKTRTGRPQCPYAITVPAAPIAGDQRSTVRRLIGDPSWTKWATSTSSTCARQFSAARLPHTETTASHTLVAITVYFRPGLARDYASRFRQGVPAQHYKIEHSRHHISRLVLREFTHHAFLQDGYPTRRVPGVSSVPSMT